MKVRLELIEFQQPFLSIQASCNFEYYNDHFKSLGQSDVPESLNPKIITNLLRFTVQSVPTAKQVCKKRDGHTSYIHDQISLKQICKSKIDLTFSLCGLFSQEKITKYFCHIIRNYLHDESQKEDLFEAFTEMMYILQWNII